MRACLIAGAVLAVLVQAPARAAGVRQLPGPAGCFEMRGQAGCAPGNGIQSPWALAVAPDGRHAYVAGGFEDYGALLSFRRDPATGGLTQLPGRHGCISNDGRNGQANLDRRFHIGVRGRCADGRGLAQAIKLQIAPDGRTLYVLGSASFRQDGDSVAVFRRDPATGWVRQIQCWTRLRAKGCQTMPVSQPESLLLSPDGRELILGGGALTTFDVSLAGTLSHPACLLLSGIPDQCPPDRYDPDVPYVDGMAMSPDGATLYLIAGETYQGRVTAFARDPATGALTHGPCLGVADYHHQTCGPARALKGPRDIVVSSDGRAVYVAAAALESPEGAPDILHSSALTAFTTSPFGQLPGNAGCILFTGRDRDPGCRTSHSYVEADAVAVTPDGRHVLAAFAASGAVVLLARDPATQELTQVPRPAGCVSQHTAAIDHPVPGCHHGRALWVPMALTISPDGRTAYVVTGDGLAVLTL
jgi:DNA-binding beta-propeller fold protein YncE